jgi:hypothetical protein
MGLIIVAMAKDMEARSKEIRQRMDLSNLPDE